jgi:hypothetical protein
MPEESKELKTSLTSKFSIVKQQANVWPFNEWTHFSSRELSFDIQLTYTTQLYTCVTARKEDYLVSLIFFLFLILEIYQYNQFYCKHILLLLL